MVVSKGMVPGSRRAVAGVVAAQSPTATRVIKHFKAMGIELTITSITRTGTVQLLGSSLSLLTALLCLLAQGDEFEALASLMA